MGGTTISVNDVVENQGYNETPLMLLYHISEGRVKARENHRLLTLQPGESRRAGCEIGILKDRRDIEDLARKMNA